MADDLIAWLEATMGGDDVPDVADSPDLASFLRELPDLSGYVGHGSCPKQPAVALGMGNTNPHVHDTTNPPPASTSSPISPSTGQRTPAPESEWRRALEDGNVTSHVPSSPTILSQPPDLFNLRELDGFWEQVSDSTRSQDQVALAELGDSGDASIYTHGARMTTEVIKELPDLPKAEGSCVEDPVTGEMLLPGDTSIPGGPDSQASSTPVTADFWEHGPEGDSLEERLAKAMMGDNDPFWGVMASPSMAPQGTQDAGDKDLPPWLQSPEQSSPESSEEPPEDSPLASPWRDPMTDSLESPLLSPLASPPPAPQCHLPSMDQLMEELQSRQLRVQLTRLPLPPGTVTCRGLPGPGAAGARKTKRPAPVRAPEGHETAPLHTIPRKRRR
nr:uncharacterized protein LOC110358973 [Columba livia]